MENRRCIKCNIGFAQGKKRPYCKPCRNTYERQHYDPIKDRNRHLKYWYGIDQNEYDKMYTNQAGKCAICEESNKKLVVDHDHISKKVRGLLCFKCNLALGEIESGTDFIKKALEYINYHGK